MAERPRKPVRRREKRPQRADTPAQQVAAPEQTSPDQAPSSQVFPIVGIGASAGGLESFTHLLQHIPAATGLAFVLVQHMDPTHESMLPELLSRVTMMPVNQVQNDMTVLPNHIYVTPPNGDMTMHGMRFQLASRSATRGLHMPIDHFFRSLAEEHGSRAIGIILSGAGSDGALGLAEIKDQGGITFVQDPRTTRFPGMPHSAIMQGGIDFILPPAGIAQELARVAQHPYVLSPPPSREEESLPETSPTSEPISQDGLRQVFRLLRGAMGVDFTCYKQSTIRRRITRRMTLRKMDSLLEYAYYIQDHPEELDALYHDLLIKVTGFFRDPETFEALKSIVLPSVLHDRPANKPIRIWVPGCATGEECYSIAICLLEFLGDRATDWTFQIFATDIDETALTRARSGRYIENIALDISPERLRRFFTKVDHSYQIMPTIRDQCTFARHDLCRDPPFSNLDLISCRNVLIYLEPAMQKRVIPLFHYALNPQGFLTLGISESIGTFSELFSQVDKKQRIFARKMTAGRPVMEFPLHKREAEQEDASVPDRQLEGPLLKGVDIYQEADRLVLNQYAPAGVLVNESMDILQFRGDTSHFLRPAPGRASLNLLQMAREGLLMDLRSALTQSQKTGAAVSREGVQVRSDGRSSQLTIRVIPLTLPSPQPRHYVVLFEEVLSLTSGGTRRRRQRTQAAVQGSERELNSQLAQELEATKQYLQSIIERYEAANEELKSANEEILSSNEELQSTNEELETAKEELQSTNEELSTVNDELRQRNHDLGEANNDLNNLFGSADLPIIVLNRELLIRRFTVAAQNVLNVIPTDIGRPVGHLNLNISIPDLESLILQAIDSMSIQEREVQDREGHWYCLRVRPYRTADNRIDGAMLLFIDIDSYKDVDRLSTLLVEVDTARHFAEGVVQWAPWPLLILDRQFHVVRANPAFYQFFQTTAEETDRQLVYTLGQGQWNIPELRRVLQAVVTPNAPISDSEVTCHFPQIGEKTLLLKANRIRQDGEAADTILLGLQDITAHRQTEARLVAALREKDVLLREVSHRIKNNLQIISSLLSLQADTVADQAIRDLIEESQRRIQAMSLLHQKLYTAEDFSHIGVATYVQSLMEDLARMYDTEGRIALDIEAEGSINTDTAIACGLIVTELVSNAFKYAFPESQPGRIRVVLRPESEDQWLLKVQDTGIGLPPDIGMAHVTSIGLSLVRDLVSQLEGHVLVDRSQGTTFTIQFPSARHAGA